MIAEAPIPCNILATVNMAKDEDKAQNNDVEQNIVVPIKKIRLYPELSPKAENDKRDIVIVS